MMKITLRTLLLFGLAACGGEDIDTDSSADENLTDGERTCLDLCFQNIDVQCTDTFTSQECEDACYTGCGLEPPPPEPPNVLRFEIEPTTVLAGQTVSLSFAVEGNAEVALYQDPGVVLYQDSGRDLAGVVGSDPVIRGLTIFTVTASNEAGSSSRDVTVDAEGVSIDFFRQVNPGAVTDGQQVAFEYHISNASQLSGARIVDDQGETPNLRNGDLVDLSLNATEGTVEFVVESNGSDFRTYTLTVEAGGYLASADATVDVR